MMQESQGEGMLKNILHIYEKLFTSGYTLFNAVVWGIGEGVYLCESFLDVSIDRISTLKRPETSAGKGTSSIC